MQTWVWFALASMLFAGFTSVIAKMGMTGISAELSLAIRTCFVSLYVLGFAAMMVPRTQYAAVTRSNVAWLALSGLTTAISWVFYYKAIKQGEVSTVALIDKGSFLVTVLMAWLVLKEPLTMRTLLGSGLILAGLVVVARR